MTEKSGTGIWIGRFQVYQLSPVHLKTIRELRTRHQKVIIFLGSNPATSDLNPMDFELRWLMFYEHFKDTLEVYEMPDLPDDRIWSQELDRRILEIKPEGKVIIYGTAQNLVERYSGSYETEVLEPAVGEHLPHIDNPDISTLEAPKDFRAGIIFSTLRRFPTVYPTVDIAILSPDHQQVLLARKPNETRFRFPGGFVDPEDESFEMAAVRELFEECGDLDVAFLTYIGSARIDDWRYRNSSDTVITHFYLCELKNGTPQPQDDIAELRWFNLDHLQAEFFVPEHRILFDMLIAFREEANQEEEEDY